MVVGLKDVTSRRGSIPQYRFEVTTAATASPLPVVGSVPAAGGGAGSWAIHGILDTQTGGPISTDNPMMYMRVTSFGTDSEVPKRMIVTFSSGQIFDTGWFGNPANAAAFADQLVAIDRPDLAGPLVQWGNGLAPTGTELVDGATSGSQIIANLISVPCTYSWVSYSMALFGDVTTGWGVGWLAVDPDDAPSGYYAHPTIPGVGLAPGVTFAAEWGPEIIQLAGGPVPLGEIVADIHTRLKVPLSKFDVSELDDDVSGLVLAGDYAGADAINTLRVPYFFDKSEHDGQIYYPKRGAAVVTTLTIDDLVEEPDDSTRQQAGEYPKKVHLFYQHANSGYAAVKATSARSSPDARVVGEATVTVPVVLDEDQAAQTAAKLHKVMWAEADGQVILSVPESFIWLIPGDNIGLDLRGQVRRLRIESMDYAAGVIKLTLKHDRQSAYTSNLTGVPVTPPTLPPSTIVGDTAMAVLDISARTDSEDDLHYLVAGTGAMPGWHGWQLQRSLDAGANYTTVANYTSVPTMGVLLDDVPAASEYFTDTTNSVRIQLYRSGQTIDSLTDEQFLSEGGAFVLVDSAGVCEVLQYLDSDNEGDGIFTLTTLHRGQLNSGARAHAAGEVFVMLQDAQHVDAQSAWIGTYVTNKAISLGASPETGTVQTATYTGTSQKEWPVASFALTRSVDNVTGTWVPRHRFGSDDSPVPSTNFRGYRVTIVGTGTITFDTTSQTFTQDVSSIGGGVTVSVSALNRITGAGPATSGAI
jgi:hypothetical protein